MHECRDVDKLFKNKHEFIWRFGQNSPLFTFTIHQKHLMEAVFKRVFLIAFVRCLCQIRFTISLPSLIFFFKSSFLENKRVCADAVGYHFCRFYEQIY